MAVAVVAVAVVADAVVVAVVRGFRQLVSARLWRGALASTLPSTNGVGR